MKIFDYEMKLFNLIMGIPPYDKNPNWEKKRKLEEPEHLGEEVAVKANEYSTTIEKKYRNQKRLLPILCGIGGVIILVIIFGNILHACNNQAVTFITKWGSDGTADGQFDFAKTDGRFSGLAGVAVDSSGNVYVTDTDNHRIQKFRIL
jgi:DNA-binding beta-propeller fold protein YncE